MERVLIDECPAGPELDAAVAKVLGLKVQWRQWADELQPVYLAGTYADEYDGWAEHEDWRRVLPHSADIAAAWEVHRAACAMLFSKRRLYLRAIQEQTRLEDGSLVAWPDVLVTLVDVFPEAICRAFLKANGVVYVEMSE